MTEARTVWKDLEFKRIGKSLEGVRVRDDIKGLRFLIVYIWGTYIQWRLKI